MPVGVYAKLRRVEHLQPDYVVVLTMACPDNLGETRHSDPDKTALLAGLVLLSLDVGVPDHVHGLAHCGLVVTGVVYETGRRMIWELIGLDEIVGAELRRIHFQFVRCILDESLDQVGRLGHPE